MTSIRFFVFALLITHKFYSQSNQCFGPPVGTSFPYGMSKSFVKADFNGDGQHDVCTAVGCFFGCGQSGGISLLLSNGNGTYTAVNLFTVTVPINMVATTDFNNDGFADVAGISSDSNVVCIFLGTGTGSINGISSFSVPGSPRCLVAEDFNNDGNADLATANFSANCVSVFLGSGSGSFSSPVNYSILATPSSLISGDFNNNGAVDLLLLTNGTSAFLKGGGNGTFTVTNTNLPADKITTAYINNDNNLDLISISLSTVSVRFGNGNFQFSAPANYLTNQQAFVSWPIFAEDFNNDGRVDLATVTGASSITIFTGNNNSTFSAPVNFSIAIAFNAFGAAIPIDANWDGKLDFVYSTDNNPSVSFLLNCNTAEVGLREINESDLKLKLFPNPTDAQLIIESSQNVSIGENQFLIYNSLGQVLQRKEAQWIESTTVLETSDLVNGIYTLELKGKGREIVRKQFIVSR